MALAVSVQMRPPPDFYGQFEPPGSDGLQHRPQEPHGVIVLREKAQLLAQSMRDFIAVQGYAWGSGERDADAEAAYEVRVIDGVQKFRRYPDGKSEFEEVLTSSVTGFEVITVNPVSQSYACQNTTFPPLRFVRSSRTDPRSGLWPARSSFDHLSSESSLRSKGAKKLSRTKSATSRPSR